MQHATQSTNLADILERVLDKGIVIAGDISISLADVELLNIKVRLLVASVERAMSMGINWWESDPALNSKARDLDLQEPRPAGASGSPREQAGGGDMSGHVQGSVWASRARSAAARAAIPSASCHRLRPARYAAAAGCAC